jgi:hypothetical protein
LHRNRRAQPLRRTPAAVIVNELSTHTSDLKPQRARPAMSAALCTRGVDDARPVVTSHSTTPEDSTGPPVAATADAAPKSLVPTTRLAWLTPDHAVNKTRPSCKPPWPLRVQRVRPQMHRPATTGENFYGKSLIARKRVIASGLLVHRSGASSWADAASATPPAVVGAERRDVHAAGPGCRQGSSALTGWSSSGLCRLQKR